MKLTKVEGNRIAISCYEEETGRSILYPVPNQGEITDTNEKIRERVKNANRLYHVFFRNDIPIDLENHFIEICKIASRSNEKDLLIYWSPEDALAKADYYLNPRHEAERKQIARNGYEKVRKYFSYEKQFSYIWEKAELGSFPPV